MKVLVVGAGAREHALAWRLATSPSVSEVLAAPGNPGIEEVAETVTVDATDAPGLVALAEDRAVDLTVIGPEAPLVAGLADAFAARGLGVFGPTAAGARLEGSKAFAKRLCADHGIPAASSRACTTTADAFDALDQLPGPYVVKADGLAAGKGVTVTASLAEARAAVESCLVARVFGDAGATVIVEEFLSGPEVSALAFTDGRTVVPLALAQDFKRALDGDEGPNTGGMGAYSPVPSVDDVTRADIDERILRPTAAALAAEGVPYRGVLYAGLVITYRGPEGARVQLPGRRPRDAGDPSRLASDLGSTLLACANGTLAGVRMAWRDQPCVGVVLTSRGYPGPFATGVPVEGLADAAGMDGVQVFHAGTARREGRVVTSGGRVLTVSALGSDLEAARARAYEAGRAIRFDGVTYRLDIAASAAALPAAAGRA